MNTDLRLTNAQHMDDYTMRIGTNVNPSQTVSIDQKNINTTINPYEERKEAAI